MGFRGRDKDDAVVETGECGAQVRGGIRAQGHEDGGKPGLQCGAHDPADQRLAVEGKGQLAASHAPGKTGGQHHGGKAGAIGHAGAPRR